MKNIPKKLAAAALGFGAVTWGGAAFADGGLPNNSGTSQILASGAIHAAAHQFDAHCTLFNAGPNAVTVRTIQVIENPSGTVVPQLDNDCQPRALGALKGCRLRVTVSQDHRYACRAIVLPNASLVRGEFELRDASDTVIQNVDLR